MLHRKAFNPFYMVLVVAGILFAITAVAYGVMSFRAAAPTRTTAASVSGEQFMQWLDDNGTWVLGGELAVLAIATFGAIGTDDYWQHRAQRQAGTSIRDSGRSKS